MSWNRLGSDHCYYAQRLTQNVSELGYVLDTAPYQHCRGCRFELGLVGGNNVSKIEGNLVDLESNLFGIDRESSRCAQARYLPGEVHGKSTYKPVCYKDINTTPKHLNKCQMFSYPGVPQPPPMDLYKCGR
jgi:hypothetical protein